MISNECGYLYGKQYQDILGVDVGSSERIETDVNTCGNVAQLPGSTASMGDKNKGWDIGHNTYNVLRATNPENAALPIIVMPLRKKLL